MPLAMTAPITWSISPDLGGIRSSSLGSVQLTKVLMNEGSRIDILHSSTVDTIGVDRDRLRPIGALPWDHTRKAGDPAQADRPPSYHWDVDQL